MRITIESVHRYGDVVTVTGKVQGKESVTVQCWMSHVQGLGANDRRLYAAKLIIDATMNDPVSIPSMVGDIDVP